MLPTSPHPKQQANNKEAGQATVRIPLLQDISSLPTLPSVAAPPRCPSSAPPLQPRPPLRDNAYSASLFSSATPPARQMAPPSSTQPCLSPAPRRATLEPPRGLETWAPRGLVSMPGPVHLLSACLTEGEGLGRRCKNATSSPGACRGLPCGTSWLTHTRAG